MFPPREAQRGFDAPSQFIAMPTAAAIFNLAPHALRPGWSNWAPPSDRQGRHRASIEGGIFSRSSGQSLASKAPCRNEALASGAVPTMKRARRGLYVDGGGLDCAVTRSARFDPKSAPLIIGGDRRSEP